MVLKEKMDEINALDNKVLRGKIKSGIVKAKKTLIEVIKR